ncbi:MAG TPA: RNA polymerase sigma factor [Polyangiaceae bacterium]|nr:RNA polymerase sigma factor [Polyangiaceae bacterium]
MTAVTTTLPAAWRNAEDAAVRDAVEAHYEVLWRFLRRMGVDEHQVEDAAQQVLIVFARRTADVPREAARSFLLGTALRVASDWRRKDARAGDAVAIDSLGDHAHPDPDAEHVVAQREMRQMLDRVLDALSPELRAVFVLAELEEMTMAAIARALSIPPGTVASRLRRAREVFGARAGELRAQMEYGGTR